MYLALYMGAGKPTGRSLMAAGDTCPATSRRLFIRDKASGIRFLIDTGADICVFPRTLSPGRLRKSGYMLFAANGTPIATYGTRTMTLNLGLRRDFRWRFLVADVSKPILGADFLAHYNLLPDLTNRRLVDSITHLAYRGEVSECQVPEIRTATGSSTFHRLLQEFPRITRPDGCPFATQHDTVHHIITTPGPRSHKNRDLCPLSDWPPTRSSLGGCYVWASPDPARARGPHRSIWCRSREKSGGLAVTTAHSTRGPAPINTQCRTSRTLRRPYMALPCSRRST